jgi:hypothetical protein
VNLTMETALVRVSVAKGPEEGGPNQMSPQLKEAAEKLAQVRPPPAHPPP